MLTLSTLLPDRRIQVLTRSVVFYAYSIQKLMTSIASLPAPALQAVLEHFCNSAELGSAERSAAAAAARLTCKRWADVSCTAIDAIVPKNIASLVDATLKFKALTAVDLRYIRIIDASAVSCFSNLRCLRRLSLPGSSCWDAACAPLLQTVATSCPFLTHLDINAVHDELAGHIAQLTQLHCLAISGRLTDAGLQELSTLCKLQQLSINACDSISDEGLLMLLELPYIDSIQLHSCLQLSDHALALLGQLTQLTALSLSHSCDDATGSGLLCLSTLKQLQHLNLSAASEGASPEALALLLAALPQLTFLDVSYCEHVGPPVLRAIAGLQHLKALGISGISPGSLNTLRSLTSLTKLQQLQMRWIGQLKDSHARFLPHLAALTALDLSYCRRLTGEGLQQLQWLTQLRALNLMAVDSEDMSCLAALQQLTGLTVSLLTPTTAAWQHIASLSQLKALVLRRCSITAGSRRNCDVNTTASSSGGSSGSSGGGSNSGGSGDCRENSAISRSSSSSACGAIINTSRDAAAGSSASSSSGSSKACSQDNSASVAYAPAESNIGCLTRLQQLTALDCSGSTLQAAALTALQQLPLLQHLGLSRCQNVNNAVLGVLGGCSALRKLDLRLRGSGCSWNCRGLVGLLELLPGLSAVYVTDVPGALPEREGCRVLACNGEPVLLPVGRDSPVSHGLGLAPFF